VATVREHLLRNNRHADFRVWRGPGSRDSSDDEWEQSFWIPTTHRIGEVDVQVDMRHMVEETFQNANNTFILEERVQEVVVDVFAVADAVHDNCMGDGVHDGEDVPEEVLKNQLGRVPRGAVTTLRTLIPTCWRML
jgi:hypothetical protein